MDDLELVEQTVTLDPGDVLLCVTDGVTERREGTRMLGDDGLADVLATCTGLTAGAVAARIQRAVERFASDAAVRRHGHPRHAGPGQRLTPRRLAPTGPGRPPDTTKGPRRVAGAFPLSEPQYGIEP